MFTVAVAALVALADQPTEEEAPSGYEPNALFSCPALHTWASDVIATGDAFQVVSFYRSRVSYGLDEDGEEVISINLYAVMATLRPEQSASGHEDNWLYRSLYRGTHYASLSDMALRVADCFEVSSVEHSNSDREVVRIEATAPISDGQVDIFWSETACGFGHDVAIDDWGGCLSIRTTRNR